MSISYCELPAKSDSRATYSKAKKQSKFFNKKKITKKRRKNNYG